jgi:hypothetical protein
MEQVQFTLLDLYLYYNFHELECADRRKKAPLPKCFFSFFIASLQFYSHFLPVVLQILY